jgi:hypothetical protein
LSTALHKKCKIHLKKDEQLHPWPWQRHAVRSLHFGAVSCQDKHRVLIWSCWQAARLSRTYISAHLPPLAGIRGYRLLVQSVTDTLGTVDYRLSWYRRLQTFLVQSVSLSWYRRLQTLLVQSDTNSWYSRLQVILVQTVTDTIGTVCYRLSWYRRLQTLLIQSVSHPWYSRLQTFLVQLSLIQLQSITSKVQFCAVFKLKWVFKTMMTFQFRTRYTSFQNQSTLQLRNKCPPEFISAKN